MSGQRSEQFSDTNMHWHLFRISSFNKRSWKGLGNWQCMQCIHSHSTSLSFLDKRQLSITHTLFVRWWLYTIIKSKKRYLCAYHCLKAYSSFFLAGKITKSTTSLKQTADDNDKNDDDNRYYLPRYEENPRKSCKQDVCMHVPVHPLPDKEHSRKAILVQLLKRVFIIRIIAWLNE